MAVEVMVGEMARIRAEADERERELRLEILSVRWERDRLAREVAALEEGRKLLARTPRRATAPDAFGKAMDSATRRGKKWDLEPDLYAELTALPCDYCGGQLGDRGIRLDRLDNARGYAADNVVPCCARCNMVRGTNLTPEQMRAIAPLLG